MKPKIIEAKIADLKPYPNNPRINDEAVPTIVDSINEFGFVGAIIINRENVIINGTVTQIRRGEYVDVKVPVFMQLKQRYPNL